MCTLFFHEGGSFPRAGFQTSDGKQGREHGETHAGESDAGHGSKALRKDLQMLKWSLGFFSFNSSLQPCSAPPAYASSLSL